MKILLLGKNGQLGWELQRSLVPLGRLRALGREEADFTRPEKLVATVRSAAPDVIVNAVAYTAVDRAESEPALVHAVNATAPGLLAREAAASGALLVHYSTDYVFDGCGTTPWTEDSPTEPLNVYGLTKRDGELAIRQTGCRHLILRASWVYASRGGNFARTMLKLAMERDQLNVIDDQVGAPTGADLLADVTAHMLGAAHARPKLSGTYHAAAAGETTWFDYARHVIQFARDTGQAFNVAPDAIRPVASSAFPTPARRPANSRLNTHKLRDTFGLTLPDWTVGVDRMLTEVLAR